MTDWVERLNELSGSTITPSNALTKLLFAPIAAFFISAAEGVEALLGIFINPVDAFATELGDLVEAFLGVPADIFVAGGNVTIGSLENFGFIAVLIALGIVFAIAFLLNQFLELESTSDLIPFSQTDFPFIGQEEDP